MTYTRQAQELLELAHLAAADALGEDPIAIDVSDQLYLADIFFIITADNPRHSRSISDQIQRSIKADRGRLPDAVEGELGGGWTVIDYGDLVVHVQQVEDRDYYALDKLWVRAPRIELPALAR